MVPVPSARRPRRLLGCQHRRKPCRVGDIAHGRRRFQYTQSGLVAQQLPHGHISLTGLCELRPEVDDFVVVAEQSARHGHRDGKGGDTFGRRKHVDHRVVLPRRFGDAIGIAAPQVDHFDAVAIDGHRGADLPTRREVGAKCIGDLAVTLVDVSADQVRRHGDFENHGVVISRPAGENGRVNRTGWTTRSACRTTPHSRICHLRPYARRANGASIRLVLVGLVNTAWRVGVGETEQTSYW